MSEYYKSWWEKNGKKTSAERRARYRDDPEYREKIKAGNRKSRQLQRQQHQIDTRPSRYVHDLRGAADILCVSVSSLRWWMEEAFFPRPFHHGGKFWFTDSQVQQLQQIVDHLAEHPKTGRKSKDFAVVLDLIQFNWES